MWKLRKEEENDIEESVTDLRELEIESNFLFSVLLYLFAL